MTDGFDRPAPSVAQVAKAALVRRPSRKRDQTIFWGVRITRDLGFPAAVAWFLLNELPSRTERILAEQANAHRQAQQQVVQVLEQNDETIKALIISVDAATQEAATVRGVLLGRRLWCSTTGTQTKGQP